MTKTLVCFLIAVAAVSAAAPDRAADRAAIRAHIERIFDAFIHKDAAELRATHAPNWLGYLEGSRTAIHGADGYMDHSGHFTPGYGMTGYKIREFDMIFQGDAAFVAFVAEVEANTPDGPHQRTLRITDFYTKQNGAWIQTGSDTDLHPESVEKREEQPQKLPEWERKELLEAREKVWRAFFSGDRATLEKLLPVRRRGSGLLLDLLFSSWSLLRSLVVDTPPKFRELLPPISRRVLIAASSGWLQVE